MQLRRIVTIFAVTLAAASLFAQPDQSRCERLRADRNELWRDGGSNSGLIVRDPRGIEHPRWSPSGRAIAYVQPFGFEDAQWRRVIVVTDASGRRLHALSLPSDNPVNAVVRFGWRDDQHLFLEGHINPSTSGYLEWDIASGRLAAEKFGSWFAVSPDGRFVAQRGHVPHGAPAPYDSESLVIDDAVVFPAAGDETYYRFASGPIWSGEDASAAVVVRWGEATDVVVVNAEKAETRRIALGAVGEVTELTWSGRDVLVRGLGGSWRVHPAEGTVERLSRPTGAALRSDTDAVRLRRSASRLEDSRCTP